MIITIDIRSEHGPLRTLVAYWSPAYLYQGTLSLTPCVAPLVFEERWNGSMQCHTKQQLTRALPCVVRQAAFTEVTSQAATHGCLTGPGFIYDAAVHTMGNAASAFRGLRSGLLWQCSIHRGRITGGSRTSLAPACRGNAASACRGQCSVGMPWPAPRAAVAV